MKNKGFIAVAAAVLAAGLTVGACGGGSSSTPSSSKSTPTTSVSPTTKYLADLNAQDAANPSDDFGNVSVAVATAEGKGACKGFNNGLGVDVTINDGENAIANNPQWGLNEVTIQTLIGVAVKDLCPQYKGLVEQQQGDSGVSIPGYVTPPPSSAPTTTSTTGTPPNTSDTGPGQACAPGSFYAASRGCAGGAG